MAGRKIRDEEEARESLAALAVGGVTLAEWSRRNGIDGRSLQAWKMNLERGERQTPPKTVRLLELVPAGRSDAEYRVRCGPFVVELDERFDEQVLARLLAVVADC